MEGLISGFQLNVIKEISGKNDETEKSTEFNKISDELIEIKFIEEKKTNKEYKGYDYYTKKAMEAKTSKETFKYTSELLKNHLKIT